MLHAGSYVVFLLFFTASSCDKEPVPTGPSDEDLARCAHVIDNGFLHQVCLNNPWPTELPPATQEGLSTFGCWINDTLAFVANDPREPARKEAYAQRFAENHIVLIANQSTYGEIDKRSHFLRISIDPSGNSLEPKILGGALEIYSSNGSRVEWEIDTVNYNFTFTNAITESASGKFDLNIYRFGTNDTLRLTDGRFDVLVSTF